ncbi:Protein of unknown function [Sanguibacter gelidistatuariae]|uniref:DUF4244 domain-containing protein n=1 Tax=Sanguibacter gelidistatuariae TaxID=1814289 RepID=A0A1G6HL08_9MICO|nr:Protein of unknown function [Sanguibacter gelidistatuariae]
MDEESASAQARERRTDPGARAFRRRPGPGAPFDREDTAMTTTSARAPRRPRPRARNRARAWRRLVVVALTTGREAGMATAEYAIATIAAVGFAGLLILILKSETVRSLLSGLIESALSVG